MNAVPLSLRLGLSEPKHDHRTLKLESYLDRKRLPHPPAMVDWTTKVRGWGLLGNDRAGDCGPAGVAHQKMLWTSQTQGQAVPISDAQTIAEYADITGYDSGTGNNDTGVVLLDMLKRWVNLGMFGSKALAFVSVNPRDQDLVAAACWLGGGVLVGAALPQAAETQLRLGQWWTPVALPFGVWAPASWGYHCMLMGALSLYVASFITWGMIQRASFGWCQQYVTEAYMVIGPEWIDSDKKAPNGFGLADLLQDANMLSAA